MLQLLLDRETNLLLVHVHAYSLAILNGIKGYKLSDLQSQTTFISRDVIFHESVFPFASHSFLPSPSSSSSVIPSCLPDSDFPEPVTPSLPPTDSISSPSIPLHSSDLAPIIPTSTPPELPVSIRKSSQIKRPPGYLQQYHCQLSASSDSSHPISSIDASSSTHYDIASSYNNLSTSYKHFSLFCFLSF